jgi:ATP-binding cassette subfamily B protein
MQNDDETKQFKVRDIFKVFQGLPRVLRLVWEASPALMMGMALITLLQGITPLATVIIARLLIDGALQGIARGTIEPVVLPVILQLAVSLAGIVCGRLYSTCEILLIYRLSNHMTLLILRKASTLDLAAFEDAEFYDRLTQARQEIGNKPLTMIMEIFRMGTSLVTLISLFGLIFQLSWWLALIALVVPIPTFLANSRYGMRNFWMSYWQSARKRQQFYIVNLLTIDTFNKEIKLFNLAKHLLGRYRKLGEELFQENKELQIKHTRLSLLLSVLPLLANAGIYLYVALQAVRRLISLGALTQYSLAINQVSQSVEGLLDSLSDMYENHLFVTMLFDFLAYEPRIVAPTQPTRLEVATGTTGLDIEFRDVSFTYPGKSEPTLQSISFTLHAGESIALVGRNGAGKTTLVKLLTRLYDPDEGAILIGGRTIKEYDPREVREQIGVIFQDYVKYNMTASENIGIGRVQEIENRALVEVAAHKSGADQVIARLEKGYEAMLGHWFEKGADLSGGEWQKIALARAFMRDAPVLILDEPTSSLDAQAEYDIFQRFRHLTAGRSVIFISHRFSTVRLADRILVIEQGRISERGSHRELLELGGKYAELFNLQAEAYR